MKKIFSLLVTLCLLLSACSAFASAAEAPAELPAVLTNLEDAAFQGEWKLVYMSIGGQLIAIEMALSMLGSDFPMNFKIADGKLISPSATGEGTEEVACVFENAQLKCEDHQGSYVIQLLEDGRLLISLTAAEGLTMDLICEKLEAAE